MLGVFVYCLLIALRVKVKKDKVSEKLHLAPPPLGKTIGHGLLPGSSTNLFYHSEKGLMETDS